MDITLIGKDQPNDSMTTEAYYRMLKILKPLCNRLRFMAIDFMPEKYRVIDNVEVLVENNILDIVFELGKHNSSYIFWYGGGAKIGLSLILLKCVKPSAKIILRIDGSSSQLYAQGLKAKIPLNRKLSYLRMYLIHKIVEFVIYNIVDVIAYQYEGLENDYKLGKFHKKLRVANQYIDSDYKNEVSFWNRKYYLGYVGRLDNLKGIVQFLEALKYLKQVHGIELSAIIVGDGKLYRYAYDYIKQNDLNVLLTGQIPQSEIPRVMNQIQFLVIPSFREGLPKVIIEGMSCGCIPIVSKVGGMKYIVNDKTGFTIESIDKLGISNAILESLTKHDKVNEILKKYPEILEYYSLENTRKRYEEILK